MELFFFKMPRACIAGPAVPAVRFPAGIAGTLTERDRRSGPASNQAEDGDQHSEWAAPRRHSAPASPTA